MSRVATKLRRPLEHYVFFVVVLFALYTVVFVRASAAPNFDGVLEEAIKAEDQSADLEHAKANVAMIQEDLRSAASALGSRRLAYDTVEMILTEASRIERRSGATDIKGAQSLEPLALSYPRFFGTPDFMPVAGIAPSIEIQERAIRGNYTPISLVPPETPSEFGRNRNGGGQ